MLSRNKILLIVFGIILLAAPVFGGFNLGWYGNETPAGIIVFSETWDDCTASVEPDANCGETWTAAGTDQYVVIADAGAGGAGDDVLQYTCDGNIVSCYASILTPLDASDEISIDYKVVSVDENKYFHIDFYDGATVGVRVQLKYSSANHFNVTYYNGATYQGIATGLSVGTWYTLTLTDLNFTANTCDYATNGSTVDNGAFYNDVGDFDKIQMRGGNGVGNQIQYNDIVCTQY